MEIGFYCLHGVVYRGEPVPRRRGLCHLFSIEQSRAYLDKGSLTDYVGGLLLFGGGVLGR